MNRIARGLLIVALIAAAQLGGIAAGIFSPVGVEASPQAAFGPQLKITVLDVPNFTRDVGGQWIKIGDVGTFQLENASSLLEAMYQGRLYVKAIQGNDVVYFQLRVDDVAGMQDTGQYHLVKREQNSETPATFSGYWQGLPAGQHTASLWAKAGSPLGGASGVEMDYLARPDNLVIVKEYLPWGATYLPSVVR